jgi:hypothetical protein
MFGQPATIRKYVSASAGQPEFGIGDKLCYQSRPTNMWLRALSVEETQMVGGQTVGGAYEFKSISRIDLRDEIIYAGELYRVKSYPEMNAFGDVIYFRGIMERASVTGFY